MRYNTHPEKQLINKSKIYFFEVGGKQTIKLINQKNKKQTQTDKPLAKMIKKKKRQNREFPGGPVVRTLCFRSQGPRLVPGWGAKIV